MSSDLSPLRTVTARTRLGSCRLWVSLAFGSALWVAPPGATEAFGAHQVPFEEFLARQPRPPSTRCHPRYAPEEWERVELLRSGTSPLSEEEILALGLGPTPVGPGVDDRDVRRRESAIWHVACRQRLEELQLLREARERSSPYSPYAYALAANGSMADMEAFANRRHGHRTCLGTIGVASAILDLGDARGVPIWFDAFSKSGTRSCVKYAVSFSGRLETLAVGLADFDYADAVAQLLERDRDLFGQLAVDLLRKGLRVEELRAASCRQLSGITTMEGVRREVQEAARESRNGQCAAR